MLVILVTVLVMHNAAVVAETTDTNHEVEVPATGEYEDDNKPSKYR